MSPTEHTFHRPPQGPLALDYYPPTSAARAPAIVLIHGGAWRAGGRGEFGAYPERFAEAGYAVADAEYRLTGTATFPAQVADVKAAVKWLRANADALGLDPDRVAAVGHSAGAHLAAHSALTGDDPQFEPEDGRADASSRLDAAVCLSGVYDLTQWDADVDFHAALVGGSKADRPDAYAAASPVAHVTADAPPMLVLHGRDDDRLPIAGARAFADRLAAVGAHAEFIPVADAGHDFAFEDDRVAPTARTICAFLDEQL